MGRRPIGSLATVTRKGPILEPGREIFLAGKAGTCLTRYTNGRAWAWFAERPEPYKLTRRQAVDVAVELPDGSSVSKRISGHALAPSYAVASQRRGDESWSVRKWCETHRQAGLLADQIAGARILKTETRAVDDGPPAPWSWTAEPLEGGGYLVEILAHTPVQIRGQEIPQRAVHPDGYSKVRLGAGHPLADRSGWAYAHRLALVVVLKRRPRPSEVVRFKDGNPRNTDPENLTTRSWEDQIGAFLRSGSKRQ